MNPKVSVLMACYNTEKFVAEAIESILGQTFKDFEFIIMDDGSTDNSSNIIKSFDDPRIVYMRNEENMKLVRPLNIGLDMARGEYIARMDSDDIAMPMRLEKQVKFMDDNPYVGLLGAWYETFPKYSLMKFKTDVRYFDLLKRNCIAQNVVMMRKSVLDKYALRYDESYTYAEDYELWSRMIRCTQIANLPEVLVKYRSHGNSLTNKTGKERSDWSRRVQQNMMSFLTDRADLQRYLISVLDLLSFPVIKTPILYGSHALKIVARTLKGIYLRLKK